MSGFDTTPKPGFLRAMQNQGWTVAGALAELVDNGFGTGRGNAQRVHITHDKQHRTLSVLDNGHGMEALGRLFQLGNTIGLSPGDIGIYGAGGTMAVLWLAHAVEVWTLREGRVSHDRVDWTKTIHDDTFPIVSDEWKHATPGNTPAELFEAGHGTLIKLHLAEKRRFQASNVKRDLASLYSPALRQGRELLWTTIGKNGETTTLADLLVVPEGANSVMFDIHITAGDDLLPVHGVVGIVEGLTNQQSRIAIGYGPRVIIRTKDCFVSPDREEKFLGAGITGWLDLGEGWQPYLTTTKDGVDDARVWNTLMAYVFQEIRPLLEKVQSETFQVIFDDLALNLRDALDEGRRRFTRSIGGEEMAEGEEARRKSTGGDSNAEPGSDKPSTVPPTPLVSPSEGDDFRAPQSTETPIEICTMGDAEMEGQLCSADFVAGSIAVYVNKDHAAVQMALQAEPLNRHALHMLITHYIAEEIISKPDLAKRLFPAIARMNEQDERKSRAIVHAVLMNQVRAGKQAA